MYICCVTSQNGERTQKLWAQIVDTCRGPKRSPELE